MTNPLLSGAELPAFAAIRPAHIGPALDVLLAQADAALERAVGADCPADFDALALILDVPLERLSRAWSAVGHLNEVADTPELRAAYNENLGRVTDLHTRIGADARLFARYRAIHQGADEARLSPPRRAALDHAIRDFVLGGAELQGAAKARFTAIQNRSAELSQAFSEHVLDATDSFSLLASAEQMAGVPADVQQASRDAAQAAGNASGHLLSLHIPVYLPVMRHAQDRDLRAQLHRAYQTRASAFGPPERDNSALMQELLALRAEEAALLGYGSYGALSLVPKMAESPGQVMAFMRDLASRARAHAERDVAELREFAASALGLAELQPWDVAFASERLKQARYAFSEQELKAYFTEPRVLAGLFDLIERLLEVRILPDTAEVWHASVRFFRIECGGELVGQFYLDPYARPGKRPGAWMDVVRSRWARPDAAGALQTPVAQLVCNFAAPVGEQPALLTHDDVVTLFHEFGHGLHHLLTQVNELAVAGISGVEWDAVELPSQFMENFCWEWPVLSQLSAHVDTGLPLPRDLFDKMLAARNFQSGIATLRQVEFALTDMRLHTEPGAAQAVDRISDEVRAECAVLPQAAYNRNLHSFSHLFDGGYAAGYYSYKWAEVLSADAFAAFEEAGIGDLTTGRRWRQSVLEVGGSRPALESFKAFRGRAPTIDALLRHHGMA